MKRFILSLSLLFTSSVAWAANPHVIINTNLGDIEVELFVEDAPITTENFLRYVDDNWYADTIFHRVIPRFMVQGGGFTVHNKSKTGFGAIQNEAENGLNNERGTLAMARTMDPHSASSQFFINTVNNTNLNHRHSGHPQGWGYAVFGKVVNGMDIVDNISGVSTGRAALDGYPHGDVPTTPVVINKVYRVDEAKADHADTEKNTSAPEQDSE